jgi:hypothetical protein
MGSADVSLGAEFGLSNWAWLVATNPALVKAFVEHHESPSVALGVLRQMRQALDRSTDPSLPFEEAPAPFAGDGFVDLTTYPEAALMRLLSQAQYSNGVLHFIHDPRTGRHRLELHQVRDIEAAAEDGWRQSTLRMLGPTAAAIRGTITNREVIDIVNKGARILMIPGDTALDLPYAVYMSLGQDGGNFFPQFSVRRPGEGRMEGPSMALLLPADVREKVLAMDLMRKLELEAIRAYRRGKLPTIFSDLDGTLFSARIFTGMLFKEWLALYDGSDAEGIRSLVAQYELEHGNITGWNGKTILMELGVTDASVLESAKAYHDRYFFDATRRVECTPPIWGMVNFIKMLRRKLKTKNVPLKTVYVSIRSDKDDTLPNGMSAAELALRYVGLWDERSVPLFYKGLPIDWSDGSRDEPEKWEMVQRYLDEHRDVWHLAFVDNTSDHLNGYERLRGGARGIRLHVQGDRPPGSSDLSIGVYTIDPAKVQVELDAAGGVPRFDPRDLPSILHTSAFGPMIDRIRSAIESGHGPTMAIDVEGAAFLSGGPASDSPLRPGVVEFMHDLRSLGVEVIYLTDRADGEASQDMMRRLELNGFPLRGSGVRISRELPAASSEEDFIALFSGSPDRLLDASRSHPHMLLYQTDGDFSDAKLASDAIPIDDFKGSVVYVPGRDDRRSSATPSEEGARLAGRVISIAIAFSGMLDGHQEPLRELDGILKDIAGLGDRDPKAVEFYRVLSERLASIGESGFEQFEDVLGETGPSFGLAYVTIRRDHGIEGIIVQDMGRPFTSKRGSDYVRRSVTPLPVVDDASLKALEGALGALSNFSELRGPVTGDTFNRLVFGGLNVSIPRLDLAVSHVVSAARALTGKSAEDLIAIERNPRLSLAAMSAFARAGVRVGWVQPNPPLGYQIEDLAQLLPMTIRDRMSRFADIKPGMADIVWSSAVAPEHDLDTIGAGARALMLQTPRAAASYVSAMGTGAPWTLGLNLPITPATYVLPTVPILRPAAMPMSFQIWTRTV